MRELIERLESEYSELDEGWKMQAGKWVLVKGAQAAAGLALAQSAKQVGHKLDMKREAELEKSRDKRSTQRHRRDTRRQTGGSRGVQRGSARAVSPQDARRQRSERYRKTGK